MTASLDRVARSHLLRSSPETVHWGYFDGGLAPVLTIDSGDRVNIECVSGNPDRVPDCHIAGVEVWYDARKPAGKRIDRVRFDNRQNLEKDRTYTLVVSDFMALGGSGFGMLVSAPREDLDVIDVDALIRYLAVLRPPVEAPAAPRFHPAGR